MSGLTTLLTAVTLATSPNIDVVQPEPIVETITTEDESIEGSEPVKEFDPFVEAFLGSMLIGGTQDPTMPPSTFDDRHFFDTWFNMKADNGAQVSVISTNPLDVNLGDEVLPQDRRYHVISGGWRTPNLFRNALALSMAGKSTWDLEKDGNLGTRLDVLPTRAVRPRGGFLLDSVNGAGGYGGVTLDAPVLGGNLHGDVDVVGYNGVVDARGFASVMLPLSDAEDAPRIYTALGGKLDERVIVADVALLSNDFSFSYLSQVNGDGDYHGKLHLGFMGANWKQGNLNFPMHVISGTGNRVQDRGEGLTVLDGWAPFDAWFAVKGPVVVGNVHAVDGDVSGDATFYLLEPLGGRVETFGGVRVGYDGEPFFGGEGHLLVKMNKNLGLELWGTVDYHPGTNQANGISYLGVMLGI
jgi:hypothetical protein